MYVTDNYDLWEQHEAEQQERLKALPECDVCCEPVQEEHCYKVHGTIICEHCMAEYFRVETADLME